MYAAEKADLAPVAEGSLGEEIRRRREAVGLDQSELAREATIGRTTLHNIETGVSGKPATLAKVLRALAAAEAESGVQVASSEAPDVEMIEFEVAGDFGVKVVVRGPISEHETLRADVAEIIRSIREGTGKTSE